MLLTHALAVSIALIPVAGSAPTHEPIKPPEIGRPAPDFKLTPLGGKQPLTLADFKGQTLILELWATWCGPCHQAREELTLLHKEFADRGLKILAVSCEQPDVVEKFIKAHPVPYQVAADPTKIITLNYPTFGIPTSYVIDSKGMIRLYGNTPTRALIAELLDRGTVPKSGTLPQLAKRHEQPRIKMEISETSGRPKHPGNYGWGYGKSDIQFQTQQATLQLILSQLLSVSRLRVQAVDPAIFDSRWDIDFVHSPRDKKPQLGILVDALCREAGVKVSEVTEEHEAWVARHKGDPPPKGEGTGYVWDQKREMGTHLNISMAELFRGFEDEIDIPIVDETNLESRYRLELPWHAPFEATKTALESKYGISLTKERRKVAFYRVSPSQPPRPAGQ